MTGLARRIGSGRLLDDTRIAWILVFALVSIYVAGLFAFYPRTFTNTDEAMYVRQARLLLQGTTVDSKVDALTGATVEDRPSQYPVGTALTLAPFIWLAGPRGAFVVPCLALVLAVLITARWIGEEGRSPLFALLVLGFVPSLVLGRVPLSGLPSTAVVALGLWLFWRGLDRGWPWWLASGFVAGSSVLFREPNVLPFVPFYAGTVVRRESKCWALIAGGLVGLSTRLLVAQIVYGDPFFVKQGYVFMPGTFMDRVPYYAFGLLVLVPGGFVGALAYRGRRWPELVASVCLFTLFYLTQKHTAPPSGPARAVVISLRYFQPLIPILAFAMAEAVPRAWRGLCARQTPRARARLEALAAATLALWVVGLGVGSVGVHWASQRWGASQAEIREAIFQHVADDAVLVTNWDATRKFLRRLDRRFLPVQRHRLAEGDVALLADRHGEFYIAFLDRSDSEHWRRDARENEAFIASLTLPHALELDRQVTPTDRLRIWRVSRALPGPGRGAD